MSDGTLMHELDPSEVYQVDSDEFDSEEDGNAADMADEEYDRLVQEGNSSSARSAPPP